MHNFLPVDVDKKGELQWHEYRRTISSSRLFPYNSASVVEESTSLKLLFKTSIEGSIVWI